MKTVSCDKIFDNHYVISFHQIQSKLDQLMVQLRHSKASEMSLKDKICKERQKYFTLWSQYKELKSKGEPTPSEQEEHNKSEEMQTSQLLDANTMAELTKLQLIMEDVSSSLAKIEVIKTYWGEKVSG